MPQTRAPRRPLSLGIDQVVIGAFVACPVANIVFAAMLLVASVIGQGWQHGTGSFAGLAAIIGMVFSFLPAVVTMIVLVIAKARTRWAYALGGAVTAVVTDSPFYVLSFNSPHADHFFISHLVLSMMAVAGAIGGVAAWWALRRMWLSPDFAAAQASAD